MEPIMWFIKVTLHAKNANVCEIKKYLSHYQKYLSTIKIKASETADTIPPVNCDYSSPIRSGLSQSKTSLC